jgi:hypothetical protein
VSGVNHFYSFYVLIIGCFILGSKKYKVSKPLASKKFYLDIKNSAALLKVESKLKALGAVSYFSVKKCCCKGLY